MKGPSTMKKQYYRIKQGNGRMTFVALVEKSRTNVTKMTGNPLFPSPIPPLADITNSADKLDEAIQAYNFSRSRLDKEVRDLTFEELKALRKDLAGYVQSVSNGDLATITSAGFETEKQHEPAGVPHAPQDVLAEVTPYPGVINLRYAGVRHRGFYEVSICSGDPKDEANWNYYASTTKNRLRIEGLVSNQIYYFRVVAVGAAGASPASDQATAKAA